MPTAPDSKYAYTYLYSIALAVLKLAAALDQSRRQKLRSVKARLSDKQLVIQVETRENMVLEKGLFSVYADAFERIFSVQPVIKEKHVFD